MANRKLGFAVMAVVLTVALAGTGFADDSALDGTWICENYEIREMPVDKIREVMLNFLKPIYEAGIMRLEEFKQVEAEIENMPASEIQQMLEEQLASMYEDLKNSKMTFSNAGIEESQDDIIFSRGDYSAEDGKLIIRMTHVNGDTFNNEDFEMMDIRLEPKWYSRKELESVLKDELGEEIMVLLTMFFDEAFKEETWDYSVNGDTLIITNEFATQTYIRE